MVVVTNGRCWESSKWTVELAFLKIMKPGPGQSCNNNDENKCGNWNAFRDFLAVRLFDPVPGVQRKFETFVCSTAPNLKTNCCLVPKNLGDHRFQFGQAICKIQCFSFICVGANGEQCFHDSLRAWNGFAKQMLQHCRGDVWNERRDRRFKQFENLRWWKTLLVSWDCWSFGRVLAPHGHSNCETVVAANDRCWESSGWPVEFIFSLF